MSTFPNVLQFAVHRFYNDNIAIELDIVRDIIPGYLPRIADLEPILGQLKLVSVNYRLLENSILVPNTVTPSREIQRGERIEKTSG